MADVKSETFVAIQTALNEYLEENPPHPNMRVFCATRHFDPTDVGFVIKKSDIGLNDDQKSFLMKTFKKEEEVEVQATVVFENYRERCRRERKEILSEFNKANVSVQEFLERFPWVTPSRLKTIIGPEVWAEKFERKERIDYESLVEALKACKGLSIQKFCEEQGISVNNFRNHCPKDLWEERYEKKRRYLDWGKTIEDMKSSGLSYQEFCVENDIIVSVFKTKAGEDVCREYDKDAMRKRHLERNFNAELSLDENAEVACASKEELEKWMLESIRSSTVAAFAADHMTPGKLENENAELKKTIGELRQKLEDKNRKVCELLNQLKTTENQLSAQKAEKYKLNNKVEQMKAKIAGTFAEVTGRLKAFQAEIDDN